MSFGGFGKNSGPSTPPSVQIPFGNFPPFPSPSPPVTSRSAIDYSDLGPPDGAALPHLTSSRPFPDTLKSNETPLRWGDHGAQTYYQRPPGLVPRVTSSHSKTPPFTRTAEAQYIERTSSPYSQSPNEISTPKNSRNVVEIDKRRSPPPSAQTPLGNFPMSPSLPRPVSSRSSIDYSDLGPPEGAASPHLASSRPFPGTFKSNETSLRWGDRGARTYQRPPGLMPRVTSNHSKTSSFTRTPEAQYVERISSPYSQSPNEISTSKNSRNVIESDKRRSPPPNFQNNLYAGGQHTQSKEVQQASDFRIQSQSEVAADRPMHFPALKRTKIALQSSPDQLFEDNLDPSREVERELLAKERRLARFKNELSQPLQSHSTIRNQKVPANAPNPSTSGRLNLSDDPTTGLGDSAGGNSDYEGLFSSSIVGLCPDMCPESERAERERKGDLDQYERLDGDRNLTSEFLAIKKYTRTAEREADLIRPMPILRKTMDYLLSLLDEPYDDRFLGLYNFLWDRMRAIRMDLRMQHIFNLEAVSLLEQMIRLHIIAMHELCEYTKGEGFSEGFDAHLNIEQMNKTSVELFQLYDDHRKKGIHVPSEREFRGYYALLKLDKHPGYKVEPAELSLDLAKMTPEMRQTPEVLFARAVARACRTGNFIAFFRLARKASYLQACLMHAHFSKLRTQALASLHSGLQINQGIPITVVAKWLAMEEEDIENLLEYYGFSVKEFGEPYMVKENTFISVENDFPVKRSKLVHSKRSRMIVRDVSFSSQNESYADVEVKRFQPKKVPELIPIPVQPVVPESSTQLHDEKMHDFGTISSPKGTLRKDKASIALTTPVKDIVGHEVQWAPASPLGLNFSNSSFGHIQSQVEISHKPVFRNSFTEPKPSLETTAPIITQEMAEENRYPVVSFDSVVHTPIQQFTDYLEDEEQTFVVMEEDKSDEVTTSYYDKEVEEAKLKLMMRIWKRRAAKKRELRERKQLTANAALSLLSMGPPIWRFEQPGSFGTFNIDHFMSERHEIRERSWSVLNPSEVVAPKLVEKNPDAKCLCWKLLLLSQEENIIPPNQITTASSWLQSKFMPAKNEFNQNLLVSSPGLSIWRTWVPSRSSVDDLTCCLSVIKSITFYEDQNKEILTGTNAVVFVLSQHIPIELQKKRLHSFVTSLPSGSRLPLLILSVVFDDPSNIVKTLGFGEIDKSKVASFYVTYLTKKSDGFLSDEDLRKGLEWLASESPPQILVRGIKTRELVLSYLNFLSCSTNNNTPNNCISAFNEALDRSMKDVINAAHENPTGWPCPDIDMLDESCDEYIAIVSYLPSTGWSRASKIEVLMRALNESKLPAMEDDDLCWLYRGCNSGRDIENQKLRLENCVTEYLTNTSRMMGMDLARKEANIMIQKFVRLELRDSTYFMIPNWILMFRRIFGWRLMNLTSGESSSTYVLAKHYLVTPSCEAADESEFEVVNPTLDELVEVGYRANGGFESNHVDYEGFQVLSHSTRDDKVVLVETEEKSFEDYEHTETEENNEGGRLVHADKDNTEEEADKLSRLLEKCNILQNKIDEKLSIYF